MKTTLAEGVTITAGHIPVSEVLHVIDHEDVHIYVVTFDAEYPQASLGTFSNDGGVVFDLMLFADEPTSDPDITPHPTKVTFPKLAGGWDCFYEPSGRHYIRAAFYRHRRPEEPIEY